MERLPSLVSAVAMLLSVTLAPSYLFAQSELPLHEVQVDDLRRTFRVYVPERRAETPGLIIVLHGTSGDAAQAMRVVGPQLKTIADAEGHIVVYPNGIGGWNGCQRGSRNPARLNRVNDVGFIEAIVEDLADAYGIARDLVFVIGYSGGGHLTYRLALERPRLIAGAAAIVMVLPAEESMDCDPSGEPVSILIMNGTDDPLVPFDGGPVPPGTSENQTNDRAMSTTQTFEYWARLAGLGGAPSVMKLPDLVPEDRSTVEVQTLASARFEVMLVIVRGGGHAIPGSPISQPENLGALNRDVDGVALIWEFFSRQMRR